MYINIKLDKNFVTKYNSLVTEYGDNLAELNGLGNDQLSYTDFIDNFVDKQTVADASIDGNANVGHKDIVSLENEMTKPHSKLLAFNKIYHELNEIYSFKDANDWLEKEWDGHFYLHDAYNSSTKPYCYAYDIQDLVDKGLYFIDGFNAKPPKHLTTYTDFVIEYTSWNCNRTSGAVGLPSFLVYSYYFWKKDCEEGYFVKSPEYYRDQEFQRIIYKLNQPYVRSGIQSAFTNFSLFDHPYLEALFGGKKFPDGTYIIDSIDDIVNYQMDFMRVCSEIRSENFMTFPVLTYALLKVDGKWVDEEFAMRCCKHNMKWGDSNFFVSDDINSLSNCCRLKSNIKSIGYFDPQEKQSLGYQNSIGGTALRVGSVKVNTINLARIAYETSTIEEYLDVLKKEVILCNKCLDVVRHILIRNEEKGLLPNYTLGTIDFKTQYNTVGIIGIYETLQEFGFVVKDEFGNTNYTDEGIEFAKLILKTINDINKEFSKDKDYMINVEQIPGERAAYILMTKDKQFHPDKTYELPLYGNQWIPLGVKTTLQEKVKLSAILDEACGGGSIAHINIDSPFINFDQAWKMLNYVADSGVTYFAFNLKISACKHNHGFYGDICPKCGEPVQTTYQRIVGFLVPEKTYSTPRKEEFKMRDWLDLNSMQEI